VARAPSRDAVVRIIIIELDVISSEVDRHSGERMARSEKAQPGRGGTRPGLAPWRERYPLTDVDAQHFGFQDPCGGLRDQQSDVAIVRPPFLDDGLTLVALGQEPRYAVLASDHPLAQRSTVEFADVIDEPWMDIETDPLWCDFWKVNERRVRPPEIGALCRTLDDLFEAARAGTAMALVPESIAQPQSWPNLAFVAVRDIAPSIVAVAWHTDDASPLVANFVELAKEVSSLPPVTGRDAQPSM
jgi:DNA-binding transcriptional LysR family regulator